MMVGVGEVLGKLVELGEELALLELLLQRIVVVEEGVGGQVRLVGMVVQVIF